MRRVSRAVSDPVNPFVNITGEIFLYFEKDPVLRLRDKDRLEAK